ncbi:proprotein convertase P-domain-containing protein [Tolypothrix sp. VBCCA 56010]|uniref:proprotein convertase P-domain-containing protein n=1 Tax=Tolypothrix sp. VBCCA 56010 TaxID=3137731 RepID=UPI003D7D7572
MTINLFDANFYRASNPDLTAAGLTTDAQLFQHFQNFGLNEGRSFSLFANLSLYRASNPDLATAGINTNRQLLDHLQNFGVLEGRQFSEFVDVNFYLDANPDVAQAFSNNREQALQHLNDNGLSEGRLFSQFFNVDYYKVNNPDLVAVGLNNNRQLLQHFETYGINENRFFSVFFDTNYYRNQYADFKAANLNNRQLFNQFQQNGLGESRASSQYFDVSYYLANNADLRTAGFNNFQAYNHFLIYGFPKEGRFGSANGYTGEAKDNKEGTATPSNQYTQGNSADYIIPEGIFDEESNMIISTQWKQQVLGGTWSATANIQFTNGQITQNLPLRILDDGVVDGDDTIIWKISNNAPFGFSQSTYTFTENDNDELIQLRLGSNIKTATITTQNTEVMRTVSATDVPRNIPDSSTITSNLVVNNLPITIRDVNVTLNITHPYDNDLDVFLISPKGTRVELFKGIGGNGDNFINTTLDDEGSNVISWATAPFTGSFSPQNSLSNFNFENPNGTWKLEVKDGRPGDFGTLNSWSVAFTAS